MKMHWFRMYEEARNDAKLQSLTDSQHRVWFRLLCLASVQDDRGTIKDYDPDLLAVEVAGGDTELLTQVLERLIRLRIVTVCNGYIRFINFEKRQFDRPPEDREKVRERVARFRSKHKNENVTACNGPVTVTSRCNAHKRREEKRILTTTTSPCTPLSDQSLFPEEPTMADSRVTPKTAAGVPDSEPNGADLIESTRTRKKAKPDIPIPEDWCVSEQLVVWCQAQVPPISPTEAEFIGEAMRNWALSKGIERRDWDAQFRTFALKELKEGKTGRNLANGAVGITARARGQARTLNDTAASVITTPAAKSSLSGV